MWQVLSGVSPHWNQITELTTTSVIQAERETVGN